MRFNLYAFISVVLAISANSFPLESGSSNALQARGDPGSAPPTWRKRDVPSKRSDSGGEPCDCEDDHKGKSHSDSGSSGSSSANASANSSANASASTDSGAKASADAQASAEAAAKAKSDADAKASADARASAEAAARAKSDADAKASADAQASAEAAAKAKSDADARASADAHASAEAAAKANADADAKARADARASAEAEANAHSSAGGHHHHSGPRKDSNKDVKADWNSGARVVPNPHSHAGGHSEASAHSDANANSDSTGSSDASADANASASASASGGEEGPEVDDSAPSRPCPENVTKGYLQLLSSEGKSEGYVAKKMAENGKYTICTDKEEALIVGVEYELAQTSLVNMYAMNSEDKEKYPAVNCIVGTGSSLPMDHNRGDYCTLGGGYANEPGVARVTHNSFSEVKKVARFSESAIFQFASTSGNCPSEQCNPVSVKWINDKKKSHIKELHIGRTQFGLIAASDKEKFEQVFGSPDQWLHINFEKHD